MKSRIVRDLYNMSTGQSETILAHLLHDYSHFSVFTIDSFFQKIIRSFAREMGLYAGYDIELDQNSALDEATNLMLSDIDNNEYLKDWLVEWAKRKIEEGKSWNFKPDVLRLGSEIFSEELQNIDPALLQETTDKTSLELFRNKLIALKNNYLDYLQNSGQMAMAMIDCYGLTVDSFSQKSKGVGGYFSNWANRQETGVNKHVEQALEGVEKNWYSKNSLQKKAIMDSYRDVLGELLQNMTGYQREHARIITTANVILKQINVLGVLCDLMRHVNEYARDQNLFLISEASGFIKKIIADADAPFIYERVGNFYNHFMIDEFQDTSSVQWNNFRPLIENSIASGLRNWIAGDVKQSIYRWRNTDWKILSREVENALGSDVVQVKNLDKNWRSAPEIVEFNNAFFREAVAQMRAAFLNDEAGKADTEYLHGLTLELTEAYCDSYQHLPERQTDAKGYVHLEMIAEEEDAEETWREKALKELPRKIERLQDLGYRLSDIAVIVRENKEAQTIADMLIEYRQANPNSRYRYDVLSNESLLINNSPAVKWLIAAMRYIVEPDDVINRAYLQHEYDSRILQGILESRISGIFELSENLINRYNLYQNEGQSPFLQAFQDVLLQYTRRETSDIRSFLDWWELEKNRKYVSMPDNQDAIQLITIHKSKGLEFDAVIIPFCDWSLCKSGKMLWCSPAEAPFSDMKMLPLRFENELSKTIFVKDYLREKMFSYIDNLNLLYVAFTRAGKALFISTPQQTKEEFSDIKNLMYRIFQSGFEIGALSAKKSKKEEDSKSNIKYSISNIQYPISNIHHIVSNSAYFAPDGSQIDKGRLLHDIFRNMKTIDDLENKLNAMITEGKLPELERKHIIDTVHKALKKPIVNRWFACEVKVKTEAEILLPDGSIVRPDRVVFDNEQTVVIDYKFGKKITENHKQQVRQYMGFLSKMGYSSVKGFLWYVTVDEVVEVH